MRIAFRTDSSHRIGTGHLMRCLTLAEELAWRGHKILFVCRDLTGNVGSLVREKGYRIEQLPAPRASEAPSAGADRLAHSHWLGVDQGTDAEQTPAALDQWGSPVDWLVVDHYALDGRWEVRLRGGYRRFMVIDDLADRSHDCDLLLDQNLCQDPVRRYLELVPTKCRTLIGPRFALLRPEFARARGTMRKRDDSVRRVLIFFGGIDANNHTMMALAALELLDRSGIGVDVVVGGGNPHREEIAEYCARHENMHVHVQTNRLAELMSSADLAIGAGGVATWERCALGLPSLAWAIADNQVAAVEAAATAGALYAPDPESVISIEGLAKHMFALLNASSLRRRMGACAFSLCDGRGAKRVADAMAPQSVSLRIATTDDCDDIHRWRNHAANRRYAINPEVIPYEEHKAWFEKSVANPNRILLIAQQDNEPVGVLRYDIEGRSAETSIFLVPGQGGKGLGSAILHAGEHWLANKHPDVNRLRAKVLESNETSKALFRKSGYDGHHSVYEKVLRT